MEKAPQRRRGIAPRKLAVATVPPSPSAKPACAVEITSPLVPPEMDRKLAKLVPAIEPEVVAASAAPPPPFFCPSRMPSRAAIVVGGSFTISPTTPMSAQPAARPVAVIGPASRPFEPSHTPPPDSAPGAYERAFRRWSQPSFDVPPDVPSTEPLTYQVFMPCALASRPRLPSEAPSEPLSRTWLLARVAAVIVGVAMVVGTGIICLTVAGEEAPSRAVAASAPPAAVTTMTAFELAPTAVFASPEAPVVADDPATAPAPPPVPVRAAPKKKSAAPAKEEKEETELLPPNPYGD